VGKSVDNRWTTGAVLRTTAEVPWITL